ncbi:MAG: DUF1176 domain-containing protein [Sphingomonas adhaesiva]|uniref:DUF1176 domain-containing protein n=1 Tax=Sphingomonas adhaesiva TaxID=28212 RepID=UPI002FF76CCF
MTPLLIAAAMQAAMPAPGDLRTFADWTMGCDNQRMCSAVALVPEAQGGEDYLMLVLRRDAAATALARLTLPIPETVAKATKLSLSVDGKVLAQVVAPGKGGGLALPFQGALAAALMEGRQVTLTDARGRPVAQASLAGLAASVLAIDEAQRRVGTRTALRRAGSAPASQVPTPPPLPVVHQPPVTGKPPRTISAKDAVKLIGRDAAVCPYANGPVAPKAYRLDATHSLVTIDHPCGNGAYNLYTSVFVMSEKGKPVPAVLDAPSGFGETPGHQVVTGGWDGRTRRLTSYVRGRGIGDCGSMQAFAWDGARFRLVEQSSMGECRGAREYITTWRARVVVE